MDIFVYNRQRDLRILKTQIQKAVHEIVAAEGYACDEVSVHLVSQPTITKLHKQFFDDPSPTDCISFPMDEENDLFGFRALGEVFVCPKTALDYCANHGGDPNEETLLYIIHGLLHLMGYDDLNPQDKRRMRRAEKRHLKHLQELNLLL